MEGGGRHPRAQNLLYTCISDQNTCMLLYCVIIICDFYIPWFQTSYLHVFLLSFFWEGGGAKWQKCIDCFRLVGKIYPVLVQNGQSVYSEVHPKRPKSMTYFRRKWSNSVIYFRQRTALMKSSCTVICLLPVESVRNTCRLMQKFSLLFESSECVNLLFIISAWLQRFGVSFFA